MPAARCADTHPPEIVALAEQQTGACVERRADVTELAAAARALQARLVPERIDGVEQVAIANRLLTAAADDARHDGRWRLLLLLLLLLRHSGFGCLLC